MATDSARALRLGAYFLLLFLDKTVDASTPAALPQLADGHGVAQVFKTPSQDIIEV